MSLPTIVDPGNVPAGPYTVAWSSVDGAGSLNRFATVAQIPDGRQADYAWPTVARVLEAGGAFTT